MITDQLIAKKILFFCVQTFGLERQVIEKLSLLGAQVKYYDERPKNNNWTKAVIRVKKELYRNRINKYYKRILEETRDTEYDYLLVIRGEVVPEFFLRDFKKRNPLCVLIFYNWDSFKNTNNTLSLLSYYDRTFSFDPYDAKENNIGFRPLYYVDAFKSISQSASKDIDLLFLGTAHSDRYIISNHLRNYLEGNGLKVFCFYYMQGKLVYLIKRFIDKSFKTFEFKKLSFKSLSTSEILNLYARSNVVLDINHPNQSGLTMRTFEAIGAKRKLITTNNEVAKMPFYNPDNILILDRNNLQVDIAFFNHTYKEIENSLYEKLSIGGWLYNLFVDDEQDFWASYNT